LARPLLALLALAAMASGPVSALATAPQEPAEAGASTVGTCQLTGGTGSLNGQLTLPGGALLPSANVRLYTADGRHVQDTTSDGAGVYSFNGLNAGSYLLYARPGPSEPVGALYAPEWYDNQADPAGATPILVYDGVTTTANIQLAPGTQVSGQVLASDGGPLPGVLVTIHDGRGQTAAAGRSDAFGHYLTSPALNSGDYSVRFSSPDRPYLDFVTAIAASPPNHFNNLNAWLWRAAQITGRVTHAVTGMPLEAAIWIHGEGGQDYKITDGNGYYTTTAGLPSGTYTVSFNRVVDSQNLHGSSQVVTVTAPNTLSGVNGTLSPGAQVTGRVTTPGGMPLSGAQVTAYPEARGLATTAATDASGIYTVTGLATGAYRLQFRQTGYVTEYYNDQLDDFQADPVLVTAPHVTGGLDAALAAGGSISGTVTAADTGLPLGDVMVHVYASSGDRLPSRIVRNGQYLIADLAAGQYRLHFEPGSSGPDCGYRPEWYNDQASLEAAIPITVNAGAVTPNINVALARGSAILGQLVQAENGVPLTNVSINVYDVSGEIAASGYTNFLGHYLTSPALASGAYFVHFSDYNQGNIDEYYNDQLTRGKADVVTVSAPNDVTGISAALAEGGTIHGRVVAADTAAGLTDIQIIVYNGEGEPVGYAATTSDGRYSVTDGLAVGSYRVSFAAPAGPGPALVAQNANALSSGSEIATLPGSAAYLPQFYNNKRTLAEADWVAVTGPLETRDINAVLQRGVFLPLTLWTGHGTMP
jgi:hypothetical protein